MGIKPQLSDLAYAAGWSAVRRMPEKAAYRSFDLIADRLWARRNKQILRFEKSLGRVMPDAGEDALRQASKQGMRSYFTYWCDAFRMPDWPQQRILGLRVVNEHVISDALGAGRGLVITAPHSGNYDHGAAYLAQKYGSITTVMERLKPEALFERFVEFREALGMEVLGTGDPGAVDLLGERARANRLVCLVGDRDLSRRGVPVEFFGEPTKMPAGPALTAIRSGAPLCAVSFWYEGRAAHAQVYPAVQFDRDAPEAVAVAQATQLIADDLARGIAEHPLDWHMLQPLWLADLDPHRAPRDA
jgi:phosphatidylinositol dimannoside acyltransferase